MWRLSNRRLPTVNKRAACRKSAAEAQSTQLLMPQCDASDGSLVGAGTGIGFASKPSRCSRLLKHPSRNTAMNPTNRPISAVQQVVRLLIANPKRWLVPTALIGVATVAYIIFAPATWESSQALIIRNEATSKENGPGKFRQPDDMKTVQETILELARSRGVLEAALKSVGAPASYTGTSGDWPSEKDIAAARKQIRLTPPKGAEFGKTEVFYLQVQDHDRVRSVALNRAIYDQLESRFQQLRDTKAQSMIDELADAVELARTSLNETTSRLTGIETQVGSDLAELRAMQESASSDSALRKTVTEIRGELRDIRTTIDANQELIELLSTAQNDPGRLLAAPNRLLDSQPGLRRLKDGLVDAQLNVARLQGSMSSEHPRVKAALEAEEEIGRRLHGELSISVRGLELELRLSRQRQSQLENQLAQITARLDKLAAVRANYANDLAENANNVALVKQAEQNLAEAQATRASAKATSLISRIDSPEAGIEPIGLKRTTIAMLGIFGGLLTGFGAIYLTVPPVAPSQPPAAPPASSTCGANSNGEKSVATEKNGSQYHVNLTLRQALERISTSCNSIL
jgi:polysaccharide biosynthesis transport protein